MGKRFAATCDSGTTRLHDPPTGDFLPRSRRGSRCTVGAMPLALLLCTVVGGSSRQHLAALCFQQRAHVRPIAANRGVDRYGRTVARVECNGMDANAEQVRAGMAWAFDRYVTDPTLHRIQAEARATRRGLW